MSDTPRIVVVSDFTISGIRPYLAPDLEPIIAPFDQVILTLLDGHSEHWQNDPELAFVWTRPQAVINSYARCLDGNLTSTETILADVDVFVGHLKTAAQRVRTLYVASWTMPTYDRGLGLLNLSPDIGPGYHLLQMNLRLIESLRDISNIHVLDANRWICNVGPTANNPKLWHTGKIAFSPHVLQVAANDIKAAFRALEGKSRKLIIVDLDDTLWGGIVGETGYLGINLGGHDPVGEAFVEFQQRLKALSRRGIALGIASKNEEPIAIEAIENHPEMRLRADDFAGWRINWNDKAQNILELVEEVNVGLDAVVFIDDNPVERERVRTALPDVFVPEWPKDKTQYARALSELDCFDALTISSEDQHRTEMYASERKRREQKNVAGSLEDYLASLDLKVIMEPLQDHNLTRATQLLNKTNQMNLATRRMTEDELLDWDSEPRHRVFVFQVEDRFGDYGLTALASLQMAGTSAQVVDYLLSCRVLGRGVEQTILAALAQYAEGVQTLSATFHETSRNAPCRRLFADQFPVEEQASDGATIFSRDLSKAIPIPNHVTLVHKEPVS